MNKFGIVPTALFMAVIAVASPTATRAGESIRSFDSSVEIRRDGSQLVRESITALFEGGRIRYGIHRDLPGFTSGSRDRAAYAVLSAQIDGEDAEYEVETTRDSIRVKLGKWNRNRSLPKEEHTFTLTYETSGHLRFFGNDCEFGWNVTGGKWDFAIERATCRVAVPEGADMREISAWIGETGSRDSPVAVSRPQPGVAVFTAQRTIKPGEHFTVSARFPGSLVAVPNHWRTGRTVIVLSLSLLFYLSTWLIWGKDPAGGTIIPLSNPPKARFYRERRWRRKDGKETFMSAAAASYLKNAGSLSARGFSSLFLGLASKGLCDIAQRGHTFVVTPREADPQAILDLPDEEAVVYRELVARAGVGREFSLSEYNAASIQNMHDKAVHALGWRYSSLWAQNVWLQAIGWLVVFPAGVLALSDAGDDFFAAMLPPTLLAAIIFLIRKQIAYQWSRSLNSINPMKKIAHGLLVVLVIAFHPRAPTISILSFLSTSISMFFYQVHYLSVATIILVALPMLFCPNMKAPSRTCRALLDKIDGLLLYIKTAERNRPAAKSRPGVTPETFERLLPYAAAFGMEGAWCAHLAESLPAGGKKEDKGVFWFADTRLGTVFQYSDVFPRFSESLCRASVLPKEGGGSGGSGDSGGSGGSFFGGGGGAGFGGGGGGGGGW